MKRRSKKETLLTEGKVSNSMKEELSKVFDEKKIKVLTLLSNKEKAKVRKVARETEIPISTTYRILKKLEDADLLEGKRSGASKVYKVQKDSELFKFARRELVEKEEESKIVEILPKEYLRKIVKTSLDEGPKFVIICEKGEMEKVKDKVNEEGYQSETLVLSEDQYDSLSPFGVDESKSEVLYKK